MADTLDTTAPKKLLVDGRNPFPDEVISVVPDGFVSIAAADADGNVFVTGLQDTPAGTVVTITVQPGAEDVNRLAGSDDITITTPTPLAVTLA